MKINSKKTLLVLAAVALVGGTFTAVALTKENGFSVSAAEDENTIWKHYAAVAPDPDKKQFGSKEFWANCSEIGTHVFKAPTIGKIQDGGDFSKTAYFKELTPEDDRYVPYEYTVTFDSNGATAIDPVTVGYGKTLTAPATPTRAEDAYYKAYTFDAWYANGKAFDFTKDTIKESVTLTAGWKYGDKKFDEVALTKESLTLSKEASIVGFDASIASISSDAAVKAEMLEWLGGSERRNDSVFVNTKGTENSTATVTFPAVNLKEKLSGGKIMSFEFGARIDGSIMSYNGTEFFKRSGHNNYDLRRMAAYLYKDGDVVKARFINRTNLSATKDIYTCTEQTIEVPEAEANGTKGMTFGIFSNIYTHQYWFSYPRIVNGESCLFDFSKKENITVENGVLQTREDNTSGAPYGQWKDTVALSIDGIGVQGNNPSAGLKAHYPAINYNELFAKGNGVRFTIGLWNGGEQLKYGETVLGVNDAAPSNPIYHTEDSIVNTWHNFQIEITKVGMRVLNHFENKEYVITLTADQLSGKKGLTFDVCKVSNGRFIYLSNMKSFHA